MIAFYFNKNKIFKGTRIVVREVEDKWAGVML
jgi:hypothetical protein